MRYATHIHAHLMAAFKAGEKFQAIKEKETK